MPSLADELQRVPLFSGLSQRQLKKLARGFKERRFVAGRTVVREGHMDGVGFFVVAEGEASVTVGGTEVTRLGPGAHFGELAMISGQARAATVTAQTPLRCLVMPFWDFRRFARDNPDVSWKLLQQVVDLLTQERSRLTQATLQSS